MSSPLPIFEFDSTLEVVCQGLGFSEGPITAAPDGSILLVDIRKQCLTRGACPMGRSRSW